MSLEPEKLDTDSELERDIAAVMGLAGSGYDDDVEQADISHTRLKVRELVDADSGLHGVVRSLSATKQVALVAAAALLVTLATAVTTPRDDLARYSALRMVLALGLLGGLAGLCTWRLLRPLHQPPPSRWLGRLLLVAGGLVPFVLSLVPHAHLSAPPGEGLAFVAGCARCLGMGGLAGLPVLLLALWARRARVDGVAVAMLAGVAAGLTGNLALQLHCPIVDPAHLTLGHASLVALCIAAIAAWRPIWR